MRSYLAKHQPVEPADRPQLELMNARSWRDHGCFVVTPDEIEDRGDAWLAQALRNLADKLYGPRKEI